MNLKLTQPISITDTNSTDDDLTRTMTYTSPINIVDQLSAYYLVIRRASFGLGRLAYDNITFENAYTFVIEDVGGAITTHKLYGTYYSIQELLDRLNAMITGIGNFQHRPAKNIIEFKNEITGKRLYFDRRLKNLIPMPNLYSLNHDASMSNTKKYFELLIPATIITFEQDSYTLNRFYNFESIRAYTSLPIRETMFSENEKTLKTDKLLFDTSINTTNFIDGTPVHIYEPTVIDYKEFTSGENVQEFIINLRVFYKNSTELPLVMAPGDTNVIKMKFELKNP